MCIFITTTHNIPFFWFHKNQWLKHHSITQTYKILTYPDQTDSVPYPYLDTLLKKKKKKILHPLHQISQSFLKVFSTFCKIKHFFSNKFITLTYIHKFTQMYTPSEFFSLKVLSFLDI